MDLDGIMYSISKVGHPEGYSFVPLHLIQVLPLHVRLIKGLPIDGFLRLQLPQVLQQQNLVKEVKRCLG